MGEVTITMNGVSISIPEQSYGDTVLSSDFYNEVSADFLELLESTYTITPKKYASISVSGFYAGNKLLNTLDSDLYRVYYPANISSNDRELQVFFLSFLAVILLSLFGVFLYSIVHAVTKM